jgi:WD40 repeat protein
MMGPSYPTACAATTKEQPMTCVFRSTTAMLAALLVCATHRSPAFAQEPKADAFGDPLPPGALLRLGTVRWRPSGSIEYLAFAPDGKRLASWHDEHYTTAALSIWDVATGRELRRVEMPGLHILTWQWLADGRGISVVHTSSGQFVWEFTDDKLLPPHKSDTDSQGGKKEIDGIVVDDEHLATYAVSPDGKHLVAGKAGRQLNREREIVVWDLATQRRTSKLPLPHRLGMIPNSCDHLAYTPDGRKLVAFCEPLTKKAKAREKYLVAVIDVATGEELRRFTTQAPMMQGSRMSAALSSQYLALGLEDENGTVLVWNLEKGEDRRWSSGHGRKYQGSGYGVSAMLFNEDGTTLITAGRDSAVSIWDVATGMKRRTIANAYPGWVESLALTRDGKRLACAGQNGIIRHWDITTGEALDADVGIHDRITSVGVTPDGTTAVTASGDNRLRIWDLKSGQSTRVIPISGDQTRWPYAAMARDGRTAIVSTVEKVLGWKVASGEEFRLPELPADLKLGRVDFADDGKTLVSAYTGVVTLLDWPSGKLRRRFTLPEPLEKPGEAHCDAATLSPDGRFLATLAHRSWHRDNKGLRFGYGDNGVLDLWNAATGERLHRLVDGGGVGRSVLFTADGDLLYAGGGKLHPRTGGDDIELQGEFHLVDPLIGRLKQSFEPAPALPGSTHRYTATIGISPDGRSVICTGNDGVIHIYETATGKIRRSLARHRDYISGLAVTTDGRRLVTASNDLTALVWDISLAGFRPKNAEGSLARDRLWAELLAPDAKSPYAAMAILAADPRAAVTLIRDRVKPIASAPTGATLDRLVAELGDDEFAVRDRAARELDELGESAVAGMRVRLANAPALETRRRLVQFLDKHDPVTLTPGHLRELRSIEVLEQLNTPDSRTVLTALAKGAPNARLTRLAAAALVRLQTAASPAQ